MKKKEKLLREMNGLDDKYVEEADPARGTAGKPRRIIKWSVIAACICLLTVSLSLWLFLPFRRETDDLSEYKDSEYYEIIKKLYEVTRQPERGANNNFELLYTSVQSTILGEIVKGEQAAPEASAPTDDEMNSITDMGGNPSDGATGTYVEVTDNQVMGVIEGDLLKRTDTRAFYLRENTLTVYSIEGENSRELGSYSLSPFFDAAGYYYYNRGEIFLSEDGKTVTLVCPYQINSRGTQVGLLSLDVSDPAKITEKGILSISGGYLSARSLNGKLLLMSEFAVGRDPDFSMEKDFLPQITTEQGTFSVPVGNIISPDTLTNSRYTVICELDQVTLEPEGFSALLSYSQQIYVSRDSIYATRGFTDEKSDSDRVTEIRQMTEISRLYFGGEGFVFKGSVTVDGRIKDQYSMDEFEGMLRAVTTTDRSKVRERNGIDGNEVAILNYVERQSTNANLYVIDIESMTVKKSVEQFAPEGEEVRSARFDGTAAYVCTSVELSDPVFFFDLSDLDNITWKDTGTIEGFSSSLINFGDGYLLGIGQGDSWSTVKLEIYEESANGVISVADYTVKSGSYSTEYKSYLIDRENQMIGLAISFYDQKTEHQDQYVLLRFDGYVLNELIRLPAGDRLDKARAFLADGYLYLFHSDGFEVAAIQ